MWQLSLPSLQPKQEFAPSSRADLAPSFSPDGNMVTCRSNRRGHMEVWVANRDGSGARPLTNQRAVWSQPVWSPDGARLLFGAPAYNSSSPYGIYVVPVAALCKSKPARISPSTRFGAPTEIRCTTGRTPPPPTYGGCVWMEPVNPHW
ncbi:MAG: PD40 domain-containing protein [Acidobacteria bacterium]|nr:PD40 domain-containing protein [Acidobacteriota bacterium]